MVKPTTMYDQEACNKVICLDHRQILETHIDLDEETSEQCNRREKGGST